MSNIDTLALREAAEKAKDNFMPNFMVPTRDVLALLDELDKWQQESSAWQAVAEKQLALAEDAEKRITELEAREVKLPLFDGYVPHIATELQAAFRIACADAGIGIKGEGE